VRDDQGTLQGFSQHLSASRRGSVRESEGVIAHRQHHLSVPRWTYNLQGDLLRHVFQGSRQRLSTWRFSPLQDQRQGMEWFFIFVALTDNPPPF